MIAFWYEKCEPFFSQTFIKVKIYLSNSLISGKNGWCRVKYYETTQQGREDITGIGL